MKSNQFFDDTIIWTGTDFVGLDFTERISLNLPRFDDIIIIISSVLTKSTKDPYFITPFSVILSPISVSLKFCNESGILRWMFDKKSGQLGPAGPAPGVTKLCLWRLSQL